MGRRPRPPQPHGHDGDCTDTPTPDPGQPDRGEVTPVPMDGTTYPTDGTKALVPTGNDDEPTLFPTGAILGVAGGAVALLIIGILLLGLLLYRRKAKASDAEKQPVPSNHSSVATVGNGLIAPPVRTNMYVNTTGPVQQSVSANRESSGTHQYEEPEDAAPPPYDYPADYIPGLYEEPDAHPGPQYQSLKDSSYVNTGAYTPLDPVSQLAQVVRGTPMITNPAYKPKGHKVGGSVLRPTATIPRTGVEYMISNLRPTLNGVEEREATPSAGSGSGTPGDDVEDSEAYEDVSGSSVSARTARYLELLENSQGGYSGSVSSQSTAYLIPR